MQNDKHPTGEASDCPCLVSNLKRSIPAGRLSLGSVYNRVFL